MRASGIIDIKRFKRILCKVKENAKLIAFITVFIFGFLFGVFGFLKFDFFYDFYGFLTENFYSLRESGSFFNITVNSFLNSSLLLVLLFFGGTSILGLLLIPCLVFLIGISYGILSSGLYSIFSFNGVAFFAILIIPAAVVLIIALILSAIEAFGFSLSLIRSVAFGEDKKTISNDFKTFCIKQLILCGFVFLSAIIDGLISSNLLENFDIL